MYSNSFSTRTVARSGHNIFQFWLARQTQNQEIIDVHTNWKHMRKHDYNFCKNSTSMIFQWGNALNLVKEDIILINKYIQDSDKIFILDTEMDRYDKSFPLFSFEEIVNIIYLRDWFNTSASFGRGGGNLTNQRHKANQKRSWKILAREALNLDNNIPNKIVVLYNLWWKDKQYRENLVNKLGLCFTDCGIESTPKTTPRSFFKNHQSDKVNFNERYKEMKNDKHFQDFIKDDEAIELNSQLFGDMSPTYEDCYQKR